MHRMMILRAVLIFPLLPSLAVGWEWGSGTSETDYTNFANSFNRDWLADGSAVSVKLEGCVWGYAYDSEEAGCLAKSSQDGTSSWYMMSNCRRAQAGFSLYASGTSGNCNSGNFKESVSNICVPLLCRDLSGPIYADAFFLRCDSSLRQLG